MDATLEQWIASSAVYLGSRIGGLMGSSAFRCLVVFALGGLAGRVFDHFVHRDECAARRPSARPVTLRSLKAADILPTEECTVCLDLMAPKYCAEECAHLPCVRLVCGHAFHSDCIGKWLARDHRQSCPVCRMDAATQEKGLRRRSFWPSCK